jgi:hypothetical protein
MKKRLRIKSAETALFTRGEIGNYLRDSVLGKPYKENTRTSCRSFFYLT